MSTLSSVTESSSKRCPSCGVELAAGAVLCIQCGYHLVHGRHLALVYDGDDDTNAAPADPTFASNPYAAPRTVTPPVAFIDPSAELPDSIVRAVRGISRDGGLLPWMALFGVCVCQFTLPLILVVVFPWSIGRLIQMQQLRQRFLLLRQPNSLSPHYEVAMAFQSAWQRCWLTFGACALLWIVIIVTQLWFNWMSEFFGRG
ncbi:MAG: zinc ribbon domain-containing protein [Planctomycetales bacterium]|nr:zinc ribbon domain-containing protein [Planctomycetales bacterium]